MCVVKMRSVLSFTLMSLRSPLMLALFVVIPAAVAAYVAAQRRRARRAEALAAEGLVATSVAVDAGRRRRRHVPFALFELGWTHLKQTDPTKAIASFTRLIDGYPQHAQARRAYLARGTAFQQLKQLDRPEVQKFYARLNELANAKPKPPASIPDWLPLK